MMNCYFPIAKYSIYFFLQVCFLQNLILILFTSVSGIGEGGEPVIFWWNFLEKLSFSDGRILFGDILSIGVLVIGIFEGFVMLLKERIDLVF